MVFIPKISSTLLGNRPTSNSVQQSTFMPLVSRSISPFSSSCRGQFQYPSPPMSNPTPPLPQSRVNGTTTVSDYPRQPHQDTSPASRQASIQPFNNGLQHRHPNLPTIVNEVPPLSTSTLSGSSGSESFMTPQHFLPTPPATRRTKSHVASACVNCKKAHLACDTQRPCPRCATLGKQDSCKDVQHKKRGRPRLRDERHSFEVEQLDAHPKALNGQHASGPPMNRIPETSRSPFERRQTLSTDERNTPYSTSTATQYNQPINPYSPVREHAQIRTDTVSTMTALLTIDLVISSSAESFQHFLGYRAHLLHRVRSLQDLIYYEKDSKKISQISTAFKQDAKDRHPTYAQISTERAHSNIKRLTMNDLTAVKKFPGRTFEDEFEFRRYDGSLANVHAVFTLGFTEGFYILMEVFSPPQPVAPAHEHQSYPPLSPLSIAPNSHRTSSLSSIASGSYSHRNSLQSLPSPQYPTVSPIDQSLNRNFSPSRIPRAGSMLGMYQTGNRSSPPTERTNSYSSEQRDNALPAIRPYPSGPFAGQTPQRQPNAPLPEYTSHSLRRQSSPTPLHRRQSSSDFRPLIRFDTQRGDPIQLPPLRPISHVPERALTQNMEENNRNDNDRHRQSQYIGPAPTSAPVRTAENYPDGHEQPDDPRKRARLGVHQMLG